MDSLVGKPLSSKYNVLRKIGEGQNALVYLAEQMSMGRNVCIKVLKKHQSSDATANARFRQEVEVSSRLRSPHTIQFYDYGSVEGRQYIVMEFLAGETIQGRLKKRGRLGLGETASVAAQIGSSLDEAHEAGVWHRDLKPENVYFCTHATPLKPFVKVLDFGFARLTDRGPEQTRLTAQNVAVGTPAYMAPERVVKERRVDHRSDLYSMAVMCFEMLTGHLPFSGKNPMLMLMDHVKKPIPSVHGFCKGLPLKLDEFFVRAMAKDPESRPSSGQEFNELLDRGLRG